jgi:hypothetical protein
VILPNMRFLGIAVLACLLLVAGCLSVSAQTVTFVQLTDAHLFDAGKHRSVQAGYEDYLDNRSSLEWAVYQVDGLAAKGKCIDFVTFTGDFGIEDVDPKQAASEVAPFFRALVVKKILIVPGNNDLKDENPGDIGRFQAFMTQLAQLVPDHEIKDLTQRTETINGFRLIGLNSASFKNQNGKSRVVNSTTQSAEMQRVEGEIQPNQPTLIFTHVPNLEDPYRGESNEVHNAWNLDPGIQAQWDRIINKDEVLGVFAGHFHDARRTVYQQDYSWAENKPTAVEGRKTWVAPPLAVKFQTEAKLQARGLLLVTASGDGRVVAAPKWFGYADLDAIPDKESVLLQAETEANRGHWGRAFSFYSQALSSTDRAVHAAAEEGYFHTREQVDHSHLLKRRIWTALIILAILTIVAVISRLAVNSKRERDQGRLVIEVPTKITTDAPVELFGAALVEASEEIRGVYRKEEQRRSLGLSDEETGSLFRVLSGAGDVLKQLADSIPDVRGVKVGKIIERIPYMYRFIFKLRLECSLGIYDNGATACVQASLWFRWRAVRTWVEWAKATEAGSAAEPTRVAAVKALAWKVASDILSRELTIKTV